MKIVNRSNLARDWVVASIVLVVTLALTLLSSFFAERNLHAKAGLIFLNKVDFFHARITKRIGLNEGFLKNVQAFFVASQSVERDEFRTYFEKSDFSQFLGLSCLGYVRYVSAAGKEDFLKTMRAVFPGSQGELFSGIGEKEKADYYPVQFMEPFGEFSQKHLGFDLSELPAFRQALEESRDTGEHVPLPASRGITGPENKKMFCVIAPIYRTINLPDDLQLRRDAFQGAIIGFFDLEKMFSGILEEMLHSDDPIYFEVFSEEEGQVPESLFQTPPVGLKSGVRETLRENKPFKAGGKKFSIFYQAHSHFGISRIEKRMPMLILAGGVAVSWFLFLLILIWSARVRVGKLAEKMLEDLGRSEKSFKEINKKFLLQAKALEAAANGIVITDVNGKFLWVNAAVSHLTGYSIDELLGQTGQLLKSGKHENDFYKNLWETVTSGHVWDGEVTNKRKDGSFYVEHMTITPVKGDDARITHFIAVKQDVTEQKMVQDALRESDERYNLALSAAKIGTWVWRLSDQFIFLDRYAQPIFGITYPNFPGTYECFLKCIHADDRSRVEQEMRQAVEKREYYHTDFKVVWPDHAEHNVTMRGRVFTDEKGRPERMSGVLWDITKQRMLEVQLRQSQKMDAVGQLAGGIAHDFNNLLTIINCYSELLAMRIPPDDKSRAHVVAIQDAGERAALLTKQLVAFSRREINSPVLMDLNKTLKSSKQMLERLVPENISIEVTFDSALDLIRADVSQINQVLMNLVVNARDALPEGGVIKIKTQNIWVSAAEVSKNPGMKEGAFVRLTVTDNGVGMDEFVQKKIFEPFFTTKEPGKGTGLGLATCYGIVKQSKGYIRVASELGSGTTFDIDFPAVIQPKLQNAGENGQNGAALFGGHETILLVEDEPHVRELIFQMLKSKGYQVLQAKEGAGALELIKKNPKVDLILTDIVMPKMGGRQLYETLKKERPELKIIFMSGYTDDEPARRAIADLKLPFLQKPFSPESLILKVRQILDQKNT